MAKKSSTREIAKKSPTKNSKIPENVRFHYLKSTQFRVIHADGAIGGYTPRGYVHIVFWNERAAIPREQVFNVNPDGKLGDEIPKERVARDGFVREMECDILMSITAAEEFKTWLEDSIKVAKEAVEEFNKNKS